MRQIIQTIKSGINQVLNVPPPLLNRGMVLVRNYYFLISPGTEGSTVRVARRGIIGKIKERPEQARQVIELLKQQGPVQTYRTVMKKLDAYSPLGYSTVGKSHRCSIRCEGVCCWRFCSLRHANLSIR
jgi:hypothetical protein